MPKEKEDGILRWDIQNVPNNKLTTSMFQGDTTRRT